MARTPSAHDLDQAVRSATRQLVARFHDRPRDFFTEADLAASLVHLLLVELAKIGGDRGLVHLQYPTPFRCDMRRGGFIKMPDESKHRRGAFDVAVFNPAFLDKFPDDFAVRSGQQWNRLLPVLNQQDAASEPIALVLFELMYNRGAFRTNREHERGKKTLARFVQSVRQDFQKLVEAVAPRPGGYVVARRAEMLVFDSGLDPDAAAILDEQLRSVRQPGLPTLLAFYSSALPRAAASP